MSTSEKSMLYQNRAEAGKKLAAALRGQLPGDALVLALPRGGVPVAVEIAHALKLPWDILVVRKIGHPENREYGVGGMAEDGVPYFPEGSSRFPLQKEALADIVEEERAELRRRVELYRLGKSLPPLGGRDVVLVDDGLATGVSARAAARYVKAQGARHVWLAVPVGPPLAEVDVAPEVDRVVCLLRPEGFGGVGMWYADFGQVGDDEVLELRFPQKKRPSAEAEGRKGQLTG